MDGVHKDKAIDPAAQQMLDVASNASIRTGWDRFEEMQDACSFGELGLCCRHCMMGPCRIDPFGEGPQKGVCGITADGMVARNLCRMVAVGASAHSDHGSHILEVLEKIANGEAVDFKIKDEVKLANVLKQLGIYDKSKDVREQAKMLVERIEHAYAAFGKGDGWLCHSVPPERVQRLQELGMLPDCVDGTIRETLHRTHMGVDAEPLNLLIGALKCALADYLGMDMATTMSDIILGTPKPVFSFANLGVLDPDAVNIAVHGHNPLISETLMQLVDEYNEKAKEAGAAKGINLVGICCTGNEVLMRHGIPLATNAASQELAVLTGALDAIVVDVQCVMPSLADVCGCFHTKLITTMSIAKIPGALHVEFSPDRAKESAREIFEQALEAYTKRDPKRVEIPNLKQETLVGFCPEGIVDLLSKVNADDPLQPLVDLIASGDIYGVVLFAGCNNYKVPQDSSIVKIAEKLAAENVLVLATGCAAGALAKKGWLSPSATEDICGDKLKTVLKTLGEAAGLERPLPPVWHLGSCVDNSRAARLCFALASKLGVDVDKLPVMASAPEAMSEKSVAIGSWAMAMGLTTHVGVIPPVMGGKIVTKILTETARDLIGSCFIVEKDPRVAYERIMETLTEKRIGLGLPV